MNPFAFVSSHIAPTGHAMVTVTGLNGEPYSVTTTAALNIVKSIAHTDEAQTIKARFAALIMPTPGERQ